MKRILDALRLPRCGSLFRDERGFTSVGMALALLITLSLVFSAAQVYRVRSASADVQAVADAAALAAENEVAEFMIAVRVCDAVVLSLSLTGLTVTGLGVAALCTPATAPLSETLLEAGRDILRARDSFAGKAVEGLGRLQSALPFLAAANAASVSSANDGGPMDASYLGMALLAPLEGGKIGMDPLEGVDGLVESVDDDAEAIKEAAARADELMAEAAEVKTRAFLRDCGDAPGYCMYERAATLAGLDGADNPLYRSVDAWSFSVSLSRAQAYYRARAASERPLGASVEERARSALRQRFYLYASSEVDKGYVRESDGEFEARFPLLPSNTDEMRATELYTEAAYPVTSADGGPVMHAWPGCPAAAGASAMGSLAQMEAEGYSTCPQCGLTAASMGKVAAASTSIENGFEHHYRAVALAAAEYQRLRGEAAPFEAEVKEKAGGLLDRCGDLLKQAGGQRIDAAPPGRYGAIACVVNCSSAAASAGFESPFVADAGSLGSRAALSASTLLADPSGEGGDVISSLLDGLEGRGAAVGAMGVVLDCWSGLLRAYCNGQEAVDAAVEDAVSALPFSGASGLGAWASGALRAMAGALGLQPANLDALRPALVNSAHVAMADDSSFSARLLSAKEQAVSHPLAAGSALPAMAGSIASEALASMGIEAGSIRIASVEVFPGGPSFEVDIALPPFAQDAAEGVAQGAVDAMKGLYAQVTGVGIWD